MRITRSGGSASASLLDVPWVCPVCGIGLKEGEVEAHCALEIETLAKSGGGVGQGLSPGGGNEQLMSPVMPGFGNSRESASPHHQTNLQHGHGLDPSPNTRWEVRRYNKKSIKSVNHISYLNKV